MEVDERGVPLAAVVRDEEPVDVNRDSGVAAGPPDGQSARESPTRGPGGASMYLAPTARDQPRVFSCPPAGGEYSGSACDEGAGRYFSG